jgi:hypothetical protein
LTTESGKDILEKNKTSKKDHSSPLNPKVTDRGPVQLSAEQRRELQNARDHHPKTYVRERSAALLQMAEGKSPHWVATHGVLKPRKPDTLYRWVNLYQTQGLAGL